MAYITTNNFIDTGNSIYKINNQNEGVYPTFAKNIALQIEAILSYHSKVLFFRFDLHLKEYTPDNKVVSDYIQRLGKAFKKQHSLKRYVFAWAREQKTSEAQHYHLIICVNGHQYNFPHNLLETCKQLWNVNGNYLSHPKGKQYLMIYRDNYSLVAEAVEWASYLAKVYTKNKNRPLNTKRFGCSRLKVKP
ncbi:inovirus Gp2 family protein [Psychrosphaera sp.]|nr:inovirus Gp2 family protein [Psychrosphaera sp.]